MKTPEIEAKKNNYLVKKKQYDFEENEEEK